MPFPDALGHCPELFPAMADVRRERAAGRQARLDAAHEAIDAATDELAYRIGRLATDAGAASDEDLASAEALAAALKAAAGVAEACA